MITSERIPCIPVPRPVKAPAHLVRTVASLLVIAGLAWPIAVQSSDDLVLFDFGAGSSQGTLAVSGGQHTVTQGVLRITAPAGKNSALRLTPTHGVWDFSKFSQVTFTLRNAGRSQAHFRCMVGNDGATGWGNSAVTEGFLAPGESKDFSTLLFRQRSELKHFPALAKLSGMNGLPGGFLGHWHTLKPAEVKFIQLTVLPAEEEQQTEIHRIAATGRIQLPKPTGGEDFFPFIDPFGQYKHANWPGKTHDEAGLRRALAVEAGDIQSHPAPPDRDQYGGWAGGPQLEATGHFRTQKFRGKWWLVDPEGRLFWSLGVNSVVPGGGNTPVTSREHYFEWLPEPPNPLASFLTTAKGEAGFDFLSANRLRKFGDDWQKLGYELIHDRFHSWGINTVGAWSSPEVIQLRRTPYTVILYAGAEMPGTKTPDPFSPKFSEGLRQRLAEEASRTGTDPWCIGYFIGNELDWGNPQGLLHDIMKMPSATPAKRALAQFLRARHPGIADLNRAWGVEFESWEGLLASTQPIMTDSARADLDAFYAHLVETWYRICREEIDRVVPKKLFLGSRLHKHNDATIAAVAKHCDVISYNLYRSSLAGFGFSGVDKPILASEFSFGALDRGMFWTGLGPAADQQDRAALLQQYLRTALENPNLVGAHWFCYNSQPVTGRKDGENGQIGLVDICDTPYAETVAALREVNAQLYQTRAGKTMFAEQSKSSVPQ